MAYISDVGKEKEEEEGRKKETEFKHIRERWCLKNNHGARKREGRRGCKRCAREWRGWSGSTTGAINSSPSLPDGGRYRFSCNYFGITAAAAAATILSRDIEPRINYPHAKTYYRAIDKTDAPQLGLARSRVYEWIGMKN